MVKLFTILSIVYVDVSTIDGALNNDGVNKL